MLHLILSPFYILPNWYKKYIKVKLFTGFELLNKIYLHSENIYENIYIIIIIHLLLVRFINLNTLKANYKHS
jgi:hypothetical protein